jgi:hypothetical protein
MARQWSSHTDSSLSVVRPGAERENGRLLSALRRFLGGFKTLRSFDLLGWHFIAIRSDGTHGW